MKRYCGTAVETDTGFELKENPDGPFVLWEDVEAEMAKLKNPAGVWVNMLRGTIAKPTALKDYESMTGRVKVLEDELARVGEALIAAREEIAKLEGHLRAEIYEGACKCPICGEWHKAGDRLWVEEADPEGVDTVCSVCYEKAKADGRICPHCDWVLGKDGKCLNCEGE